MVGMDKEETAEGSFVGRRGRPAKPTANPLGEYLRRMREERGWTIRQLAKEVGMPETSAGYLSQLETGAKVPSPDVAERLAERLGDRRGIFQLWSMTGRRTDPRRAAHARRELARLFDDPSLMHDERFTPASMASVEILAHMRPPDDQWLELPPAEKPPRASQVPAGPACEGIGRAKSDQREGERRMVEPFLRYGRGPDDLERESAIPWLPPDHALRVPLLPEGTDPRDHHELMFRQSEQVRLEPDALPATRLDHPFAYRLSAEGTHRVRHLMREGDIAVMTREVLPIVRQEVYGVCVGRRIVLSSIIWNGRELLLLPAPEDSDFVVVPANRSTLSDLVVARVATVVRQSGEPAPRQANT
jgi:transcriptional regulator with XRE-family HTH domain